MKRRIISMFLAMLMVFMSVDLQVFAQSATGCNQVGIRMIPETEKEDAKETPTPVEGEEIESPMVEETEVPTKAPAEIPTEIPIEEPTQEPTEVPVEPTEMPVVIPTAYPTEVPSEIPTVTPKDEEEPSIMQTAEPSEVPEGSMSPEPTETAVSLEARESVSPTALVDEAE